MMSASESSPNLLSLAAELNNLQLPPESNENSSSEDTHTSASDQTDPLDVNGHYLSNSDTIPEEASFRKFDSTVSGTETERTHVDLFKDIHIPIVGYEVTEEKAKFTVFKLRIENKVSGDCWFVFRRYTDFSRLQSQLKLKFPNIRLPLPRKKWFGDNFNQQFLEERTDGLQEFINSVLKHQEVCASQEVKTFFCLDEPPNYTDSVEETRAVFEVLEETIYYLRRQLKEKEMEHEKLKQAHCMEIEAKLRLASFIQDCTKDCSSCTSRFTNLITKEPS